MSGDKSKKKREDADDDDVDSAPTHEHEMLAEIAAELADEFGEVSLDMALKRLPAVPSVREVKALFESARKEPRDLLILRLFYYTGVRLAELAALTFADVCEDDEKLLVRNGKGGFDRYVLVDRKTLNLVRAWRGDKADSDSIIGIQNSQIARIVHDHGRLTGIVQKYDAMGRGFSPHSLRHAFATHRYDSKMDLATIQRLLGHRFLTTTMIYIQVSTRHMLKEYRRTDPMRGK